MSALMRPTPRITRVKKSKTSSRAAPPTGPRRSSTADPSLPLLGCRPVAELKAPADRAHCSDRREPALHWRRQPHCGFAGPVESVAKTAW